MEVSRYARNVTKCPKVPKSEKQVPEQDQKISRVGQGFLRRCGSLNWHPPYKIAACSHHDAHRVREAARAIIPPPINLLDCRELAKTPSPVPMGDNNTIYTDTIQKDKYLIDYIEGDHLTLKVISTDGMAVAKSFLQLLKEKDLSKCKKVELRVYHAVDLQLLTMYLAAPPENFEHRFGGGVNPKERELHIALHNEGVSQLFNLITCTVNGRCSLLQEVIPYFKAKVAFAIKDVHVEENLKDFLQKEADKNIGRLAELFPSRKDDFLAHVEEIKRYISDNVRDDIDAEDTLTPRPQTVSKRTVNLDDQQVSKIIRGGVLYSKSDETTHLSVDSDTIVIVDAGSPSLAAALKKIRLKNSCSKVKVFLTHFHYDHTASLKKILETCEDLEVDLDIYIPEKCLFQSMGYFISHPEVIEILERNTDIKVHYCGKEPQSFENTTFYPLDPPVVIEHFINSRGYVQVVDGRAILYSGDINPQPGKSKEDTIQGVYEYLAEMIDLAIENGGEVIDAFIDVGHFPNDLYSKDLQEMFNALPQHYFGFPLSIHKCHQKNNLRCELEVI
ncbi:MAG: MBL fold metallo-hydrolase [Chlamydiota bacterium]